MQLEHALPLDTMDTGSVSLQAASASEATLIANLLELYLHDLSVAFPRLELGPDGRFGYEQLPLYWMENGRFPFIIRARGQVAGFVLAKRGSPALDDPRTLDIAEFFVMRRHRRSGVGRKAAFMLWQRLRGTWTVRASEANPSAVAFWSNVVAAFTRGSARQFAYTGQSSVMRVFAFES